MLATEAMQTQIVANQLTSALRRSADKALWQLVLPGRVAGTYTVPSTSRDGLTHLVTVRARRFAGEAAHACYACSCEARSRAGCIHRAAVYQRLLADRGSAIPTGVAAPKPAPAELSDAEADRQADEALAWLRSRQQRTIARAGGPPAAPRRVEL